MFEHLFLKLQRFEFAAVPYIGTEIEPDYLVRDTDSLILSSPPLPVQASDAEDSSQQRRWIVRLHSLIGFVFRQRVKVTVNTVANFGVVGWIIDAEGRESWEFVDDEA